MRVCLICIKSERNRKLDVSSGTRFFTVNVTFFLTFYLFVQALSIILYSCKCDSEDEEPEEAVVRKPVQKKRKLESAQNPASKRAKTQVSFDVEDSDSEIDVEAENRHVHSQSQLPNVATKKRPPKKLNC